MAPIARPINASVDEPPPTGLLRADETVEKQQTDRLKELKSQRSQDATRRTLDALSKAARTPSENLIPHILEAVKAEVTLGEISVALRAVFGEHRETVVL